MLHATLSLPAPLRCLLRLSFLLLTTQLAAAQAPAFSSFRNRTTDSLWAELRRPALPDTQRVFTLFSLQQEYYTNDDAAALRIGKKGLAVAQKNGFALGELMMLSGLSRAAVGLGDLPQAERWTQQMQRRVAQAPTALRHFAIVALQMRAQIASEQQQLPQAIAYLRQAEQLLPLVKNRPNSDFPLNVYYGLSAMYSDQLRERPVSDSLLRLARYYTVLQEREARRLHRPAMLGVAYQALAMVSDAAGSDSANYYMPQAMAVFVPLNELAQAAQALSNWAEMDLRHHRYPAGIAHARQALAAARSVRNADMEVDARDQLANGLAATGQLAEAFRQAQRARQLHDSVAQLNNQSELQQLQVSFDTQRKESQIKSLTQQQATQQARAQQQQQRLWLLGGGLGLAALSAAALSVLALRLRRSQALLATQHQRLEVQNEELVHTRASQDRLYALVAHDLRSPVVAFAGLADLVHRYVQRQDMPRLASLSGQIRQTAQTLSELLDNLLNWAISQRGELMPQPRSLHVADLLAEIADLYQHAAAAADVTLTIEAPADLLVQADPNMTRTILRNLTGNALKATPTGGEVCLRAHAQPHGISLEVSDTGVGLNASALAQLGAGPGLRVAEHGRGAGLGLLLSRSFAEAQGGTLVLGPRPDGAATGTLARLVLPAVLPAA